MRYCSLYKHRWILRHDHGLTIPVFANVQQCFFIQGCWNSLQRLFEVAGLIGPAPRLSKRVCVMNNLCIVLGSFKLIDL